MSIPLIGITSWSHGKAGDREHRISDAYTQAVNRAGAAPVVIPQGLDEPALQALADRLDGVLFSGGGDIERSRFNGPDHPSIGKPDPDRDQVELTLFQETVRRQKPFLGICRGIQLVNVACGGSLYVHIPAFLPGAIPHDFQANPDRSYPAHAVRLAKDCRLAAILAETEPEVNSLHHQGVERLGEGLRACGWTADGLVEALEMPGYPFGLAVQWHPESMPESLAMQRLFRSVVEACQHG